MAPMHAEISVMDWLDMDLYEDYKSPFDFDTGVNRNYLYLSPSMAFSPPGSPVLKDSGNCFYIYNLLKRIHTIKADHSSVCFLKVIA